MKKTNAFSLIEILIVIGILTTLSSVTTFFINPLELLEEMRDSNRLSDLNQLNTAVKIYELDKNSFGFLGTSSIVYVSLPSDQADCSDLGLPALPEGWTYNCVPSQNLKKINGSGWVPVDFESISYSSPLAKLPIDPVNTTSSGYYYTYTVSNYWELTAMLESPLFQMEGEKDKTSEDGGDSYGQLEDGNNLSLNPVRETNGLMGYWRLSQSKTNGLTMIDLSTQHLNGVSQNSPVFTANQKKQAGRAMIFNGSADYINIGSQNVHNFSSSSDFTISLWFKTNNAGNQTLIAKKQNENCSLCPGWSLSLGTVNNGAPYAEVADGATRENITDITDNLADNRWHHIIWAVSRNGTLTDGVWLDGIYKGVDFPNSGALNINTTSSTTVGANSAGNSKFNGSMSDVRIYNRILSGVEIQAIYNATK